MFKEQKGITLVALVITIIVLLILAGVSISLVVGDNGVLGKAKNAKTQTEDGVAEQEIQLSINDVQAEYLEAWSSNQDVENEKANFFTDDAIYKRNCVSAKSVTAELGADNKTVTVTYVSGSNKTYTATFKIDDVRNTYTFTK